MPLALGRWSRDRANVAASSSSSTLPLTESAQDGRGKERQRRGCKPSSSSRLAAIRPRALSIPSPKPALSSIELEEGGDSPRAAQPSSSPSLARFMRASKRIALSRSRNNSQHVHAERDDRMQIDDYDTRRAKLSAQSEPDLPTLSRKRGKEFAPWSLLLDDDEKLESNEGVRRPYVSKGPPVVFDENDMRWALYSDRVGTMSMSSPDLVYAAAAASEDDDDRRKPSMQDLFAASPPPRSPCSPRRATHRTSSTSTPPLSPSSAKPPDTPRRGSADSNSETAADALKRRDSAVAEALSKLTSPSHRPPTTTTPTLEDVPARRRSGSSRVVLQQPGRQASPLSRELSHPDARASDGSNSSGSSADTPHSHAPSTVFTDFSFGTRRGSAIEGILSSTPMSVTRTSSWQAIETLSKRDSAPGIVILDHGSRRRSTGGSPGASPRAVYGDAKPASVSATDLNQIAEESPAPTKRSSSSSRRPILIPSSASGVSVRRSNTVDASMPRVGSNGLPIPVKPRRYSASSGSKGAASPSTSPSASELLSPPPTAPIVRSSSSHAAFPSLGTLREDGASSHTASSSASTPTISLPFPVTDGGSTSAPTGPGLREQQQHKRWNSELVVERPLIRRMTESNASPRRKRRASFTPERSGAVDERPPRRSADYSRLLHADDTAGDEDQSSRSRPSSKGLRTRIVLHEHGKPALVYQLGECIGRGQFGSVYRGLNMHTGEVVAVKRISLAGKNEADITELSQEIETLQSVSHPSVIKYLGFVRTEHYMNIILEFVENGSLLNTLKSFGELTEELAALYTVKILEALSYLHSRRIVHCDLKAANILSTKHGNIKLSDFGVSLNQTAARIMSTQTKDVNGTPNWMAPEVITLQGASTASDIWSLACTIVELVTGKPPYADILSLSALWRIVEDKEPPIPPSVSPELCDFLALCFAKEPEARPTADELFDHPWLAKNWNAYKKTNAQDSLPFAHRLSAEMRHRSQELFVESPVSGSPAFFPMDAPLAGSSPVRLVNLDPSPMILPRDSETRLSLDSLGPPRLSSWSRATSPLSGSESTPMELQQSTSTRDGGCSDSSEMMHTFVKSRFSKAMECKLCFDTIRKHALICADCGIICHKQCSDTAPLPCNRRRNLGRIARHQTSTSLARSSLDSSAGSGKLGLSSLGQFLAGGAKGRARRQDASSSTDGDSTSLRQIASEATGTTSSAHATPQKLRKANPRMASDEQPSSPPPTRQPLGRRNAHSRSLSQPVRQKGSAGDCVIQ